MSFEFKDIETTKMKLADMKPAEYNPRKITERALTGLGKSMEKFGNMVPMVWNKRSGNIVGGHQRYKTLVEAGIKEAEVVVVDLDDNEEMALNIALNSRELRGDFTAQVVEQLKLCEARLGDVFDDVGLKDLLNFVGRLKFDEDNKTVGDIKDNGDKKDKNDDTMYTGPDALITCPRCRSSWRMKDNRVIFDSTRTGGKTDG